MYGISGQMRNFHSLKEDQKTELAVIDDYYYNTKRMDADRIACALMRGFARKFVRCWRYIPSRIQSILDLYRTIHVSS